MALSRPKNDALGQMPEKTFPARSEKYRVGIIGLGKRALSDHVPGILASDSAKLVAVCDTNRGVLIDSDVGAGVAKHTNYLDMLGSEQLDFVIIAAPHVAGRKIIEAAAHRHVHVLKEKPFAISLDEGQYLVELCANHGIKLMVTLQRRFNPIYTSFWHLADRIGTPFLIDSSYSFHIVDPSAGWRGHVITAGGPIGHEEDPHSLGVFAESYEELMSSLPKRFRSTAFIRVDATAQSTALHKDIVQRIEAALAERRT